jgi:hypothetical protein
MTAIAIGIKFPEDALIRAKVHRRVESPVNSAHHSVMITLRFNDDFHLHVP